MIWPTGVKGQALAARANRCCLQKQRQKWGTGSISSPILCTQAEATVRHWQHQLANIVYTSRGNSETLAAPARQYCIQNRGNNEALSASAHQCCVHKQRQRWDTGNTSSPIVHTKQRQQWGTGSTSSPILRTKQMQQWGTGCDSSPILCIKQRQKWGTGSTSSPILYIKTEAKVRHWQHKLTNIVYKNRGKSEALAAPAHQYCV